jgi:hypothetical protein
MAMTPNKKALVTYIIQFDKTDPLWDKIPEMGVEGLIATLDDEELEQKLIEVIEDRRRLLRSPVAKVLTISLG